MHAATSLHAQRTDLEQELQRVIDHGRADLDVVVFADLDATMGPPLDLSDAVRGQIYELVVADIQRRIRRLTHLDQHAAPLRAAR